MPRGKDWIELVRATFRSVGREEMSGLWVREWRNAREKLTAEDHEEIERERKRPKRFFKSANAVLFGLSKRLTPARRVLFGAVLLFILLSIQGPLVSRHTRETGSGVRRTSEFRFYFDNGMLLASITLLTLLLAMELVDKINYRDELDLARELQASLIPKVLPGLPGFELGAYNRIANMVGGDIYDFVLLPDGRLAVLFGDASGHGMTAGLVMAVAHAAFRTQLETDAAPEAMFATLNRILCRTGGPRAFFGGVYLLLSRDGSFTGSIAGHPPVLRIAGDGQLLERIGRGAYPLGVKTPLQWQTEIGRIAPGEALLLHSDGLSEARDSSGAEFGDARVESSVRCAAALPAPGLVEALARDVMAFCGREAPEDDVSIAVIRHLASDGDRGPLVVPPAS
jgi:serine phosphatase RsbU (regulator of sigma subunit)